MSADHNHFSHREEGRVRNSRLVGPIHDRQKGACKPKMAAQMTQIPQFCHHKPAHSALAGLAILFLSPLSVAAQVYPCSGPGPGEIMVGMTQAGNGVASVPLCAQDPNYVPDNGGYDPGPAYDPMQVQVDTQVGWMILATETTAQAADAQAKLESDPTYQAYKKGKWDFAASGDAQHRRCTAFFATLDGAIAIGGRQGDKEGTFLTFLCPDIPAPKGARRSRSRWNRPTARRRPSRPSMNGSVTEWARSPSPCRSTSARQATSFSTIRTSG